MAMNSGFSFVDLIGFNIVYAVPLYCLYGGIAQGFRARGEEIYNGKIEVKDGWWWIWCGGALVLYIAFIYAICWVGGEKYTSSFLKNLFMYGTLPILSFIWLCKDAAVACENWQPRKAAPRSSAISKMRDILDQSRILDKLNISTKQGLPLVCLYQEQEGEWTKTQQAWRENWSKVSVSCEDRGLIVGSPGSGKTTYLIAQLIDWMASGKSFVATDIKPEIWATLRENGVFERFGYKDWVINPTDPSSHHYNIFSEVGSSAELNEILAVLIPNLDDSAEVFAENARRLLKAVVIELGERASLSACQRFINACDDTNELLKTLRQSDNEVVSNIAKEISRTAKNDNLLSSIMTSLSKAFAFLDDERIKETTSRSDLALKDVLLKPKQAVFLQFEQEYKNTTATLFGATVAHTLRILQISHRKRDDVFVALDEIINCAPIPKFIDSLNTMRSAKMPTFLYLQALEGLNRVYGDGADRLFMGACDFKAVFKIGDIATAKVFSDLIGVTETTITNTSSTNSSGSNVLNDRGYARGNDGVTHTNSNSNSTNVVTQIMQVIEPDEFIKLKPHDAVCIYRGEATIFGMPAHYFYYPCETKPQFATIGEQKRAA